MKKLIFILLFLATKQSIGQTNAIEGNWLTVDGERKINVFKKDNKFFGKIIWVKDKTKNSEIGKLVITDLEESESNYDGGTFIMPSDKHSANCSAKVKSGNVLQVTIFHGLKIFGHNLYLSKTN